MTPEEYFYAVNRDHFVLGFWVVLIGLIGVIALYIKYRNKDFAPFLLIFVLPVGLWYLLTSLIALSGGLTSFLGIAGAIVGILAGIVGIATGVQKLRDNAAQKSSKRKR